MEKDNVQYVIDMINKMDFKDILRFIIKMSESDYTHLNYIKKKEFEQYDKMLKVIDEEYRTTLLNFRKLNFTMAKLIEMTKEQQNQVALYLFNKLQYKIL